MYVRVVGVLPGSFLRILLDISYIYHFPNINIIYDIMPRGKNVTKKIVCWLMRMQPLMLASFRCIIFDVVLS